LLRLYAEDGLNDVQKLWFQDTKPAEELYDCEKDPHNLKNLAKDPAYHEVLVRLRSALDEWRAETRDKGDIDEALLKEQGWPNGVQPVTSRPHFVPNAPENRHLTTANEGGVFTAPTLISLYSATQGASIAYTLDAGDNPDWHLYVGPIRLNPGTTTIRAQSIRYGFKHSEIVEASFEVN
jgi:N-sulfoglucosamine sulfohydrolase